MRQMEQTCRLYVFPILRGVEDKWRESILKSHRLPFGSLITYEGGYFALREDWYFKRGDIYLANLNPFQGSEQGGTRPVLVLQNNTGNYYCPTIIVAPITSRTFKKRNQPTHYYLKKAGRLHESSIVQLEQIKTIDKRRASKYLGKVDDEDMAGIEDALRISLGIEIPEEMEAP